MEELKNNEEIIEEDVDAPEITLDELLKDPKIQAQFDKKLEGARTKWEAAWQKKTEEAKIEAEKLARMTEDEKHQLALNKEKERADKAESELNAYKLKDEAAKIASEKDLDISLLGVIDYSKETAESVKMKIDSLDSAFKKAVEKRSNDMFKQASPKQVESSSQSTPEKTYLDNKYKNNPYYKG
ncbi:MAG: DUF4355 domain-containing protein [Erysipelotrichaceae bacterium]|nr:DUF4355 domain-containing protein [Erysipelotrichaceae bacterium]